MKKLISGFLFIVVFVFLMVGCASKNEYDSPIYEGKGLNIKVIGEKPDVREKNIQFQPIQFD